MNHILISRLHREDMLATLLSQFDGVTGGGARIKCVPSYVAPDLVKFYGFQTFMKTFFMAPILLISK